MKSFLLVCCAILVTAQAMPPEQKERLAQMFKKCMSDVGVTKEMYDSVKHDLPNNKDPKIKALVLCSGKMMGMVNADGTVNMALLTQGVSGGEKKKLEDTINGCLKGTNVINEENIFTLLGCYAQYDKKAMDGYSLM